MIAVRFVVSPMLICVALVLAQGPAAGAYCVKGTYASTPNPSYYCAFGAVNFTVSSWTFQVTSESSISVTASPAGTLPTMHGTMNCLANTFSVSATLSGTCTETYSLSGTADAVGHWTGTFRAAFTGGSACMGCSTNSWSVEGTNESADVPASGTHADSLELIAIPNPTHGPTLLRFTNPGADPVTLEIFDLAGRRVQVLLDHAKVPRGSQQALWQPALTDRAASGLRYAKLTIGNRATFRRIVVLR